MRRPGGLFIVLEGPDKSGKSTQAERLVAHLREKGLKVLHTREPGGTALAEEIRRILLNPKHVVEPMAELLLYEAARAQHTREKLTPALRAGATVVSERYTLATLVYQGFGRGIPLHLIRRLNEIASEGLKPHLTFILDIPDREFGSRHRRLHDRLERESSAFRRRLRRGYRELARREPRSVLLDGTMSPGDIQREIAARIDRTLSARRSGRRR